MNTKILKNLFIKNRERLLDSASKCTGTSRRHHEKDFKYAIKVFDTLDKEWNLYKNRIENILIVPKGKILMVLSSNEPLILSIIPVINALAAGNSVFLRPSSINQEIVRLIVKLLCTDKDISGRLQVANYPKIEITNFVKNNSIDFVYWFGSYNVVQSVLQSISKLMVEFEYECEGNDFLIVMDSSEINKAVNYTLHSITNHNGQSCNAIKHVVVHKKVYKQFLELLKEKVEDIVLSDAFTTPNLALESLPKKPLYDEYLNKFNEYSISKEIASRPLLVEIKYYREQISSTPFWGPLLTVSQFIDFNKLKNNLNKSEYGLGITFCGEFSKIKAYGFNYSRININKDPLNVNLNEPWGGIKKSGTGGARSWFEKFTNKCFINYKF